MADYVTQIVVYDANGDCCGVEWNEVGSSSPYTTKDLEEHNAHIASWANEGLYNIPKGGWAECQTFELTRMGNSFRLPTSGRWEKSNA
jgi:hypothetical protein